MTARTYNSEFLPRDPTTRESLSRQLQALRDSLVASNPFYGPKLRAAGLADGAFTVEQFCDQMPCTTRDDWVGDQERHPPYGTNLTFPIDSYSRFSRTSGSTGIPKIWLDTPSSWHAMLGNWLEVYAAAGVTSKSRIFFAFSFGPFLGFWTAFDAATQLGCMCVPGSGLSTQARLSIMADLCIDTLCCTPTYAIHLGQTARAQNLAHSTRDGDLQVKKIIVAGEAGGSLPATRARITELWGGAEVYDHHGMTEVGPVTYQAPGQPGTLIVMESSYLAEVIAPDSDRAVAPGEEGELVLTTLQRVGSPLLRYRTGDLVRAERRTISPDAPDHLCLDGGILGRTDDMVVVRGVNIFPSAIENIVRSIPQVAEYQVDIGESRAMIDLALRVEWLPACHDTSTAARQLEQTLRNAFALRIPVHTVPSDTLPRFEIKAHRWGRKPGNTTGPTS